MDQEPGFDLEKANRYFSAACFNRAWDYMDKPNRTPEEEQAMLLLSLASLWHWTQRPDCTPGNLSVGYWQVSRVYTLLGQADAALKYGQLCLKASQGEGTLPFHLGYAYEALARAEMVNCNQVEMEKFLKKAHQVSDKMADPEAKKRLLDDLATIK
jgi:hypothetical protein